MLRLNPQANEFFGGYFMRRLESTITKEIHLG